MDILLLSRENDPTLTEIRFYTHRKLSKRFWCRYGTFWSIFAFALKLQWESVTETKKCQNESGGGIPENLEKCHLAPKLMVESLLGVRSLGHASKN